jgi:HSP20 family protein
MNCQTTMQKPETATAQPERTKQGRTYLPTVDIIEKDTELLLVADMPGVTAENVSINYERGLLTVSGTVAPRQDAGNGFLVREYGVGDFYRSFQVGEGIDAARIEAEMSGGVLTLHLPKRQEVMPRKITVKTA